MAQRYGVKFWSPTEAYVSELGGFPVDFSVLNPQENLELANLAVKTVNEGWGVATQQLIANPWAFHLGVLVSPPGWKGELDYSRLHARFCPKPDMVEHLAYTHAIPGNAHRFFSEGGLWVKGTVAWGYDPFYSEAQQRALFVLRETTSGLVKTLPSLRTMSDLSEFYAEAQ